MKNLRIIITVLITSVIAIFMGSAIRSYYLFLKEPVLPVLNAHTEDAAILISSKSTFKLFESVNNSSFVELFNSESSTYNQINKYLDSIYLKSNKLKKLIESSEIVLGIYPNGEFNNWLITLQTGKTSGRLIRSELNKIFSNDTVTFSKSHNDITRISNQKGNIWYYIKKGILTACNDSILLHQSLEGLESNKSLASDSSLAKLALTRGKRVDGNIIINTRILTDAIWPGHALLLEKGTPFDGWISFDLNFKKNSLQLGGFSSTYSAHLFREQEPIENQSYLDYPGKTTLGITLALSDIASYSSHFLNKDTLHVKGYDKTIKEETIEIFKPKDHIKSWIGNSVSLIFTNDYFSNNHTGQLVMIDCRDKDSAAWYLKPFIEPINDSVGKLHYHNLATDLFGSAFNMRGTLYYMISKNYVNISADKNLLSAGTKQTNTRMKDIETAKENVGNKSTISVLIRPESVAKWLKNNQTNKCLLSFLSRQSSIGFQYNAGQSLEYTHAWIYPNIKSKALYAESELARPKPQDVMLLDSDQAGSVNKDTIQDLSETSSSLSANVQLQNRKEIDLKSSVQSSFIVNGPNKKEKYIAVITERGELIIVDSDGKKQLSFKPKEPLITKVEVIDLNNDGRYEYLVASKDFLYHLDSKGKITGAGPIKLPSPLKGAFSVFDYDSKSDYRVLYVGIDNKIYNVTIKGTELPDWRKPSVSGAGKISFHRTNGRDYLIYQHDNQIKIFDRRGRERIELNKEILISKNSKIYQNKTNSKGIFLSSSKKGELLYINQDGKISKTVFGDFNDDPYFTYYDFDADGSMDFIYTDHSKIIIYNRLKEVITSKKGNYGNPFFYASSSTDNWLFTREVKSKEVIALHNKGKALNMSPLHSDTDPIVFNPGGSKKEVLVTSQKDKLVLTFLENI